MSYPPAVRVIQALRVVVVRGHGEERPGARGKHGDEDEDDGDGDEDAADDGPAVPLRPLLQRASTALPPRDSSLHLSPHDSIGSVNGRSFTASRSQTTDLPAL